MAYIKWTFRIILILLVGGFLHYTLPQRDIVRIVNTYEERQDFGGWNSIFWSGGSAGTAETPVNRDVLFISTKTANDDTIVFRNEDTAWGWPPYFKFDTADLQAEAADTASTAVAPRWVAIRHYGWRNTWLSIFPNALSMQPVAGPDTRLIPWFSIVFLSLLTILCLTIWRLWRNFRQARIDPVFDEIDETADEARGAISGFFRRWFRRGR